MVGVLGAIVSFFVFGGARGLRSSGPTTQPIDAVPKDTFLVATIDVTALRRSSLFQSIFGTDDFAKDSELTIAKGLGLGGLADACGFDPLERVRNLAVAVPEEGDHGEFGVIAHVDVTPSELETCARALQKQAGGSIRRKIDHFTVLEDPAHREIAYGEGGLLIVGKGAWFDAMLSTAEHRTPNVEDAREHAALRRAMADESGSRTPIIVVTALLPRKMRDRLKSEMASEESGSDSSAAIMSGVLGVSAVGLALRAGEAGQNIEARAELVCDGAGACAAVKKLLEQKKLDWSRDLGLRAAGFGSLVDSLEIEGNEAHLRATTSVNASTLSGAIDRTIRWR